ncbi:hypothetical protein ATANTOWER_025177 [Ataeniobius toweri]|uniref:C2H2-type domain-containing protein n=1 Tax=Ataeniobius toweri TaxID=208326 RepID=A0ABU7C4W7_9TELE|nr:hypothetical protein [Ataeniobius toweri]
MGTKVRIPSVLLSTDSRKIKLYPVSPPKHIIMALREWKSGRFSMPDMSTALHAQECNDVSSRSYSQQSMADRNHSKVLLHFSKCNICDTKCKASSENTSNLRKHLVKHKI